MRSLILLVRGRIAIKLTLTLVGFVAVALLAAGLYLNRALQAFAVGALEARLATAGRLLHDETRALLARAASPEEFRAFVLREAAPTAARVTIIEPGGAVIADSDVVVADLPYLENQARRPEVRAALAGSIGRALRTGAAINAPLLYVALPVRDTASRVLGVLRLALPLSVATSSHAALQRVLLAGGLLALVIAFGIGLFVARRVTRPVVEMEAIARRMSEGDFGARAPVRSVDEIGALGRALNVMMAGLKEKIGDLEQEREKARAILDGMVEGVVAVDAHQTVLVMNEQARAMFGVGATRGEGKPFLEVIRNVELQDVLQAARAARDGLPVRRELRFRHLGDRVLEINAVPLALAPGERGAVMVLHDVTALRRLEQVRTEFVANVSHELRTPLTAIQGYLETLLGGGVDATQSRRFLDIAFRHTERLGRLLNDLTDLSNIELGKVTLRLTRVRVNDVVESTLALVRAKAEAGGVGLAAAVPNEVAVLADHDRLAQILINLVDNAVKYTRRGGQVTVSASARGDGRTEIVVTDTGIGISRADLPRITERFYRVDKARSRELGGTGLGLAIVKHLVTIHGGELAIESEEERGTTVRVTLPGAGRT